MPGLSQNLEAITTYLMPSLMWNDFTDGEDELLKRIAPTYTPYDKVQYDQYDNPWGITEYRGLGAEPAAIPMSQWKKITIAPGYWGEKTTLEENLITRGREPGSLADPISVGDIMGNFTLQLKTRLVSLIRKAVADTVRTGIFTNTGRNGTKFAYQINNYSSQMKAPAWANTSANFITDMLNYKAGFQKGSSSKFGRKSVLLMNSLSIVDIWKQTVIQATYKSDYGASFVGLDGASMSEGINQFLSGKNEARQGWDLPPIVIYDYGYYNSLEAAKTRDKTNFNYIIPYQSALWIGERPSSQVVGQFQLTRHAGLVEEGDAAKYPNADDLEEGEMLSGLDALKNGLYVRVHYHNAQPHGYMEEVGFNGSPVIGYPDAVAAINWTS